MLFELMSRQPLFVANGDDTLEPFELDRLARWDRGALASAVDTAHGGTDGLALFEGAMRTLTDA